MPATSPVGPLLRKWRQLRKQTQLQLALEAEVSTRHLSCVETGKAAPSRELLLVLASVLELPLRERNLLLAAGGFAPVYRETDLNDPEMASILGALTFILDRHEPFPAVVVDGTWNLLRSNLAGQRITQRFVANPLKACMGKPPNLIRILLHPDGIRPHCPNWEVVAGKMLARLHREVCVTDDPRMRSLLLEVLDYPGVPSEWRVANLAQPASLLIPMVLRDASVELSLFTTITTLGTAQDITLQELRIETLLPADPATEMALRKLADPDHASAH